MKKAIGIGILLTASFFASWGQTLNTAKLDSLLNTLASKEMALGSLAISQNGIVTYRKAIGFSFIVDESKVSAKISTKYRIGSTTKMFTAVMIFQLIEEGKLRLDQKLSVYFPDLPAADKITIQHLLQHRSGLHDYTRDTDFENWMDKPRSPDELLKIIREKGSDFEPGMMADYCNSNYLLLGYIIERVGKMPYADVLKKRITSPLKLKNTHSGKPFISSDNESTSYKYANQSWTRQKETELTIHGGAGSIISTPTDLVAFIDALFAHRLISQASLAQMKTITDDYGMGMFQNKYGSNPSFGHNGRIEEFYTALWHFPKEKLSFAYCTNGINYPRTDLIEGMLKICFNEPYQIPFTKLNRFKSVDLDKYLGQYSSDQIIVNCAKDGNTLSVETRGKSFDTEEINDNYFMNAASGYFFEFFPAQGELLIKETDNTYFLKRTK